MTDSRAYLLVGGSGGIGSAVAERLAARGDRLLLAGRNEETLASVAAQTRAETAVVDARDIAAVRALGKETVTRLGRLDGVVNLVGSILLKPAHITKPEEVQEVLAANLNSAFGAVQAGADGMRKMGGSIVLMSSAAARHGLMNHEAIAAAKGAVLGLMRSAAATYANWGVRVNAVAPGLVESPMSAGLLSAPASREASEAMHPLGRVGTPAEVADAVVWFLDQPWVTGQVLGVDGGLATVRSKKG